MSSFKTVVLLLSLTAMGASAQAQTKPADFRVEEVTAAAGLAVGQLKPKTILFMDRPSEELIDPDAGLIRFEDWAREHPTEKQFLTPFPSYVEPTVDVTVDGVRKRVKEKLHMYVAQARFVIAVKPAS